MPGESSGKRLGLFGKKGLSPDDVKLCIINKYDREVFFQSLRSYGWEQAEEPFEFERDWSEKTIRKAAREHSADVNADLLVEIRDRDYSTNPHNDLVYYVWRSGPYTRGLPPPPSTVQQQMWSSQMRMIEEQQRNLIQQQQMLQRAQTQMGGPQQPPGTPAGQVCSRCGGNQIQFMANGMGKCIRCGFMFQWQTPAGQPQPQPQMQPQMQPPPQQQPPPQPQPQPQMPQAPPPVQSGAPTPPGSRACPQCGNQLNVFPDGSSLCSKCGFTGK